MLRVILGGVALAATGYGIKKYLEDEENCEHLRYSFDEEESHHTGTQANEDEVNHDNRSTASILSAFWGLTSQNDSVQQTKNALEPLIQLKEKLGKTLFKEIEGVKRSVKNLPYKECTDYTNDAEEIQNLEVTPENSAKIAEFCMLLEQAKDLQNSCLNHLENAFSELDDFEKLSDVDLPKAIQLATFDEAIQEAFHCAITFDGIEISKMAIRTFNKLRILIEKQNERELDL